MSFPQDFPPLIARVVKPWDMAISAQAWSHMFWIWGWQKGLSPEYWQKVEIGFGQPVQHSAVCTPLCS